MAPQWGSPRTAQDTGTHRHTVVHAKWLGAHKHSTHTHLPLDFLGQPVQPLMLPKASLTVLSRKQRQEKLRVQTWATAFKVFITLWKVGKGSLHI